MSGKMEPTVIWPRPQEARFGKAALRLTRPLRLKVEGEEDWLVEAARSAAAVVNRAAGRTLASERAGGAALAVTTMERLPGRTAGGAVDRAEGYVLSIDRGGVRLAGKDARGVFYGAQTLARLLEANENAALPTGVVRDWPRFGVRGAHVYMPGRGQIDFFLRFLDFMARLKFNTLILEVSGGMQYERHPEISEAWRRYCRDADGYEPREDPTCERFKQRHPRGANAMSSSRYYWKDSTHTELGGGDCLSKDEVRRLLDECRRRQIEVIPEVQSLSHSYYLCYGHREIAERADDPWPDTYCPSNPRSYELLFDVMDEVIEVFRPRIMHIGHDEVWTFGVCPKCRRRSGHDLLAEDLNRICRFLDSRGVRPFMWGDTLMKFTDREGKPAGGVRREYPDAGTGKATVVPATHKAAERIPKNMLICDWYWSLDPKSERHFHEHGFEVVYGNWSPFGFENWERRAAPSYVLGAEISSWCEVSAYAFGHNGVLHGFYPGADMLWRGVQMKREEAAALTTRRMPPLIDALTGRPRWLVSGGAGRAEPVDLTPSATPLAESLAGQVKATRRADTVLGTGPFELMIDARGILYKAIVLGKSNPKSAPVPVGRKAKRLLVLHGTTMKDVFFVPTYYSYHRDPAELLRYTVRYADGKRERFSAYFGDDIGPSIGTWPASRGGTCFRSVPVALGGTHTLYAQEWTNPRPGVAIESLLVSVGPDATEVNEAIVAAVSVVP